MTVAFFGITIGVSFILVVHSFLLLSLNKKQEKLIRQLNKVESHKKKNDLPLGKIGRANHEGAVI